MKEEEKNPQQTTEGQTSSSSQPTDDQKGAKGAEGAPSQVSADEKPRMEDERTGEGTGARAGEYS